jgi:hypothetical protein
MQRTLTNIDVMPDIGPNFTAMRTLMKIKGMAAANDPNFVARVVYCSGHAEALENGSKTTTWRKYVPGTHERYEDLLEAKGGSGVVLIGKMGAKEKLLWMRLTAVENDKYPSDMTLAEARLDGANADMSVQDWKNHVRKDLPPPTHSLQHFVLHLELLKKVTPKVQLFR